MCALAEKKESILIHENDKQIVLAKFLVDKVVNNKNPLGYSALRGTKRKGRVMSPEP